MYGVWQWNRVSAARASASQIRMSQHGTLPTASKGTTSLCDQTKLPRSVLRLISLGVGVLGQVCSATWWRFDSACCVSLPTSGSPLRGEK